MKPTSDDPYREVGMDQPDLTEPENLVPMEPGKEGRSWILQQRLFQVITTEFSDMTVAETTGVLFALATQFNLPR